MIGRSRFLWLMVLSVVLAAPVEGQRRSRRMPPPAESPDFKEFNVPYDGLFTFVRLRYTPEWAGYGGGGGFFGGINYQWDHDYPRADQHVMTILKELTSVDVQVRGSNILGAEDPELFKYPVAYMAEPGWWTLTDQEAATLRAYLTKGGFIIFDDFAGERALWNLVEAMRKVLPGAEFRPLDASHPVFHSFFDIDSLDYRHPYYGVESYFLGIFEDNDPNGRLMAVANFNNDIGESWEWSDRGFIPIDLSNRAFRLGVNYFMYALTH